MDMSEDEADELVEFWTLLEEDRGLLVGKRGATALGFALLLKSYSRHGRFPRRRLELPEAVVNFMARQVGVDVADLAAYEWSGRTVEYRGLSRIGTVSHVWVFRGPELVDFARSLDSLGREYRMSERGVFNLRWISTAPAPLPRVGLTPRRLRARRDRVGRGYCRGRGREWRTCRCPAHQGGNARRVRAWPNHLPESGSPGLVAG